jgi:hypothetical protein
MNCIHTESQNWDLNHIKHPVDEYKQDLPLDLVFLRLKQRPYPSCARVTLGSGEQFDWYQVPIRLPPREGQIHVYSVDPT